ncbi:MAG TPA: GNAT family N-acetyltransferase [Bacillota bacterium]|nr:GNAT family N-acetyltransferase [Bacillota bacterium]
MYEKSLAYLKADPFKHLATLKHLTLYQDKLALNLVDESPQGDYPNWAVLATIPTGLLSYDTATYPEAKVTLFLNGTAESLKQQLLDTLPPNNYVLKLNEALDWSGLENRFRTKAGNSFLSFSGSTCPDIATNSLIPGCAHITDEAIALFQRNGYTAADIRKYFDRGAVWFSLAIDGTIRSGCFIYPNYGPIWEIAGVHTLEADRNKGYGRIVVTSALTYLLRRNLVPRYEVDVRNTNSIKLAQSLGMKEFLRLNHFLLSPL